MAQELRQIRLFERTNPYAQRLTAIVLARAYLDDPASKYAGPRQWLGWLYPRDDPDSLNRVAGEMADIIRRNGRAGDCVLD